MEEALKEMIDSEEQSQIIYWKKKAEEWESKFRSQCSKMGAYKAQVTRDVKDRERMLDWREEALEEKKKFLENNNYESLNKEKEEIIELRRKVEENDDKNREQLKKDFEDAKQEIIDELSKELIRWTEENDIDNQRSQGYVIGINKAKKVIREKMIFNLETKSLRMERVAKSVNML